MIHRMVLILGCMLINPSVWAAQLALLIGNNQYGHGIEHLANPINDVQGVAEQLQQIGFRTTIVTNANRKAMLLAIDEFSQGIRPNDTILFFYAGHGASVNGVNYLIPSQAELPNNDLWLDEQFIDLDRKIASRLSQSPARYKLIVMDACRDNPLSRSRSAGTRAFARTDQSAHAQGIGFLYSASKGQQALDGRGQHSPFSEALIQSLRTPNLTWPELVEDVTIAVQKKTQKKQDVWQEGNPLARLVMHASSAAQKVSTNQTTHVSDVSRLSQASTTSGVPYTPNITSAEADALSLQGQWFDPQTGLIWSRCVLGQQWTGKHCKGKPLTLPFAQAQIAIQHSDYANQQGWRLPQLPELQDLVNRRPPKGMLIAPDEERQGWFWSDAAVEDSVVGVSFSTGMSDRFAASSRSLYVRLVRVKD